MAGERTYRITCDECGYSEVAPQSRLPYEEGKTCPRCYKGKMYWVPPAEEARRREVKRTMPEEERRISIAWAIPAILLLGIGGGLGLILAMTREEEAPPEVYTCPICDATFATEEELNYHIQTAHPEVPPPVANLYGVVTDAETGYPLAGVKVTLGSLVVYTDANGAYGFEELTPGSYTITFEKDGYETVISDILLVEGNNELNVEMVPIAAAPFTFSNETVYSKTCPRATAWEVPVYDCRITNPSSSSVTHRIEFWEQKYSHTYGKLLDPTMVTRKAPEPPWDITLGPGQSYDLHLDGYYYSPEDGEWHCWPNIPYHYTVYYWLQDENGNMSRKVSVYRA